MRKDNTYFFAALICGICTIVFELVACFCYVYIKEIGNPIPSVVALGSTTFSLFIMWGVATAIMFWKYFQSNSSGNRRNRSSRSSRSSRRRY